MIFKQVKEIISGTKTQTRRIRKDDETSNLPLFNGNVVPMFKTVYSNHRIKWQVGRKYAVCPARTKPQVYYRKVSYGDGLGELQYAQSHMMPHLEDNKEVTQLEFARYIAGDNWRDYLEKCGYKPLYIELTDIRCEPLLDIHNGDAFVEGVKHNTQDNTFWDYQDNTFKWGYPRNSYQTLWDSINTRKGTRWEDNPEVWVLEFKVWECNHA